MVYSLQLCILIFLHCAIASFRFLVMKEEPEGTKAEKFFKQYLTDLYNNSTDLLSKVKTKMIYRIVLTSLNHNIGYVTNQIGLLLICVSFVVVKKNNT